MNEGRPVAGSIHEVADHTAFVAAPAGQRAASVSENSPPSPSNAPERNPAGPDSSIGANGITTSASPFVPASTRTSPTASSAMAMCTSKNTASTRPADTLIARLSMFVTSPQIKLSLSSNL